MPPSVGSFQRAELHVSSLWYFALFALLTCRLLRLHRWSGRELLQRRLLQFVVPPQPEHLHPLLGHGGASHGGRCVPVQLRLLLALAGFGVRLSSGWVRRMGLMRRVLSCERKDLQWTRNLHGGHQYRRAALLLQLQ